MKLLLVEDNQHLRAAMRTGMEALGVGVTGEAATGEQAVALGPALLPDAVLMDVELKDSRMNGIQAAAALRRELPRLPIVFYSIEDDDSYYRDFRRSGILSHYAYVRKSNYLLPSMVLPLLRDAISGRSFIDPEIEARVQEVRHKDEENPLDLLEPVEREIIPLLAQGLTNEQISRRLGLRDARAVARANGQIYTAWGLNLTTTDEKVARTRAAMIFQSGQMIVWDEAGRAQVMDNAGKWVVMR